MEISLAVQITAPRGVHISEKLGRMMLQEVRVKYKIGDRANEYTDVR